ncbi:putative bifunctional diguanylate cyclase/phosphodiesterase [Kangiella koreensis]|uniref:cyclic-guanylate-specific phosphodiesterase n=1 Tax=Kangiella koreensis (strain DSM 16069 / JCM 12317 / KCTC 12182 / SW-125) TaxID=523791 RepID=C7R6S6_KANKD|nr:GGDEF domain-containing phosphodiesterase [Kangiella koreensis]ACV25592.1 diguanylate cyclase/phosphodiesterase [Kangiella koreensis DSM 16069]
MEATKVFDWIGRHRKTIQAYIIPGLVVLAGLVYVLVYATGGIKYVYSHSMYIPILLAGFIFGIKGGILMGLFAGFVLGPFMPINIETGEMQQTANWLYRTGFFTLIGAFSGAVSDGVGYYMRHLKWLSRHNDATELPNRSALFDALKVLREKRKSESTIYLVLVSIENTLELKSAFGFNVIDQATRQLAKRLQDCNGGQVVYHTDSAQLALVLTGSDEHNHDVLEQLGEAVQEPVLFNDIPIHIEARMGYAMLNKIKKDPHVYLQRAEAALALAQERDQDVTVFSPEIVSKTEENLMILGELKNALANGQISLHYQPKIDLSNGNICSVEALMRWNHPERGMIPPGLFIPRAEQSTLIQTVTEFALEEALSQIKSWKRQGIEIPIAVNISTRNLLHPHFTDLVLSLLEKYQLSGECLELEVTEGSLMVDMEKTIDELIRLAGAKLTISIDDFGTGYSSLQYLHRLPASLIKIDQSFVRRLPNDKGAAHIIDAAVTLAKKMDIQTIAEGVETREVYDYLRNIGCNMVQGYYIAKPLPVKEFNDWYQQRHGVYG